MFVFSASPTSFKHISPVSLFCHLWTERSSLYSYSQDEEKWQGKDFSALIFLLVVWISTTSGRVCGNTMGCMCQHWKSELESSQVFFFFPACKKASSLGGILGEWFSVHLWLSQSPVHFGCDAWAAGTSWWARCTCRSPGRTIHASSQGIMLCNRKSE